MHALFPCEGLDESFFKILHESLQYCYELSKKSQNGETDNQAKGNH